MAPARATRLMITLTTLQATDNHTGLSVSRTSPSSEGVRVLVTGERSVMKPSDPAFDRLMNHCYYRLYDTTMIRIAEDSRKL